MKRPLRSTESPSLPDTATAGLISVPHEEGNFNQLRAPLGNDIAIKAYREGKLPFPDGTIIVAHWNRVPSDEGDKVFGRIQA